MRSLFDRKEAAIRAQMDVEAGRHASEMAQAKLELETLRAETEDLKSSARDKDAAIAM